MLLCIPLLAGCATEPVKNEQGLAKRIGQSATVEGVYETDASGAHVRTTWGTVPLQRSGHADALQNGTYVYASGQVARGRVTNGSFTPSTPDRRGIRPAHDLVLRDAKVAPHARPATQPASTTQPLEAGK
jgi:hypothetical protein